MWFDVPQAFDRAEGSENVRICRTLQPDILVNNRAGGGCGDYATPEQRVGRFDIERPWETCMTICRQWSWKPDDKMKSLDECLQVLIRTAGGNGNLLFNVGPMPTGEIEPRQARRLQGNGRVAGQYGDSDLRDAWRSVQTGETCCLHPQRQHDLPAHPGLARANSDFVAADCQDCPTACCHGRQSRSQADTGGN